MIRSSIYFILGVIGVILGFVYMKYQERFTKEGVTTQAVVTLRTDETVHHTVDFIPTGTTHNYYVDYTYQAGGMTYSRGKVQVPEVTWESVRMKGSQLPIKYLADEPGTSELVFQNGSEMAGVSWVIFGGAALCFLMGFSKRNRWAPAPVYSGRTINRPEDSASSRGGMRRRSTGVLLIYAVALLGVTGLGGYIVRETLASHVVSSRSTGSLVLGCGLVTLAWLTVAYVAAILLRRIVARWFSPGRQVAFFLGIILVGFGVVARVGAERFAKGSLQTQAVVVNKVHHITHQYVNFINTGDRDDYSIDFTYEVEGKTYSFKDVGVRKEVWESTPIQGTLPIRYIVKKPEIHEFVFPGQEQSSRVFSWGAIALGVVVMLLSVNWTGSAVRPQVTSVPQSKWERLAPQGGKGK